MQNLAGMTGGSPIGGSLGVAPISIEMGDSTAGTIAALSGATFGPNGQLIFTGDGNTGGISGVGVKRHISISLDVYIVLCRGGLWVGFQNAAFLHSRASFSSTFLRNCGRPPHVIKLWLR